MDTPDRPRAGAAGFEDSPVFNFINNLSPIPPPKPSDTAHNVQLFKSSDLAPVSSIFASPHVDPAKEPKILIRDDSVQLPQDLHSPNSVRTRVGSTITFRMIRCRDIVSENCNTNCRLNEAPIDSSDHTSNSESQLPQSMQNGVGGVESDKDQCADVKTDLTMSQECTDLEGMNLDESGPDKMDSSHSGMDLHESQLSEQKKDEAVAYNGDYMIANQPSSDMLTLGLPFVTETQSVNDTQKADNSDSGKSLLSEEPNYYIQNSAHEPHLHWTGAVEGASVDYTPQALPGALQSQLMPCDNLSDPQDYMPTEKNGLSQHLRGMRRRSLFNEKAGASNKSVDKASDCHSVNSTTPKCKTIPGDINSKLLRTPPCALPGIGLHLNALAAIPKEKIVCRDIQSSIKNESSNFPCPAGSSPSPSEQNIINDEFAQRTDVASAEPSSQGNPKKKRHKFDDGTSCKRCSCKKSKCLKLYCECFAAGVYCSEPCTCQGCLNNESHMETVLSTRQQIESRNPSAFAPKVIHTSEPGLELGIRATTFIAVSYFPSLFLISSPSML